MDPRMLLNPRAALKEKKSKKSDTQRFLPSPASSSTASANPRTKQKSVPSSNSYHSSHHTADPISPTKTAPSFNPHALLDPRSKSGPHVRQQVDVANTPLTTPEMNPPCSATDHSSPPGQSSTPDLNVFHPPSFSRENSTKPRRRMVEELYGVEARTEQPRKKVKAVNNISEENQHKSQKFKSSGTGLIGDYMKNSDDPNAQAKHLLIPATQKAAVVDLTNEDDDDDDDDIKITGSTNLAEKEVFFGAVYANVDAYTVPKPRVKSTLPTVGQWAPMKCTFRRRPQDVKNTVITVMDPHDVPFANVEQRVAKALAPVMDNLPKLRTQARLLNRAMLHNEWPHQPCSQVMKIVINIYGRRGDAEKIGRYFGQHNVWFMDSTMKDAGIETVNPHKIFAGRKNALPQEQPRTHVSRNVGYQAGSEEEAARTVARIFDHHASEKIQETDAPPTILTPLLSHQKQALTFMLRHEKPPTYGDEASGISTLWSKKFKKNGSVFYEEAVSNLTLDDTPPPISLGGLLADVMGLGKTLESLSLVAASANAAEDFGNSQVVRTNEERHPISAHTKGTLIVCPMSTVANWESQIKEHLDPSFTWYTHHGPNRIKNAFGLRKFDIVITTYGTLQSEARRQGEGVLRALRWFRIILDEAHTIREPSAQQSQACYELSAERRWCLTGTPIQNKLADLGSLCQFLRLFPYDSVGNFQHYIGKRAGSGDPSFLLKLRIFIDSFTLRRQRDQISLPEREDLIAAVEFSEAERKLHDFFRERAQITVNELTKKEGTKKNLQVSVLQGITILRLISAHGRDLLREDDLALYKGGDASEPIDLDEVVQPKSMTRLEAYELFKMMSDADFDSCRNCDTPITGNSPLPESDTDALQPRCVVLPCQDLVCGPCFRQYQALYDGHQGGDILQCPLCNGITTASYHPITGSVNDTIEEMQASRENTPTVVEDRYSGPHSKTRALIADIKQMEQDSKEVEAKGEPPLKCVVFSEFTSHLNLIGRALHDEGYKTARIDGSMSLSKRKRVLEALATEDDVTILLASIKAAGQGLNLTAASRAFIMEPLWNPAAEAQAVDRIYRIGQTRSVIVKRYHMKDSIEEVIMKLAAKKQKLADLSMNRNHKVLSKKEQREEHYNEIRALFEGKKR